jgi:hypothetical protein
VWMGGLRRVQREGDVTLRGREIFMGNFGGDLRVACSGMKWVSCRGEVFIVRNRVISIRTRANN